MVATLCRAQYVKLTLNLVRDSTYYQINHTVSAATQTINGQKNNINTTINSKAAFTVTAIRDSLYDITVKYQSLSVNIQSPVGNVDYNADKIVLSDPASTLFAKFKNQPFHIVLTKSGNLQSVDGIGAIFDRLINSATQLQADQKTQLRSIMEQSFGEAAFRSNFEMATTIFPSVPVRQNAFWISDTQLASVGKANIHTIYQLKDITDDFYHVHANSTILFPNKNMFVETNGMPVKNNLDGFITAEIVLDKKTGWIKQSTITQTIYGNTEIKDNPKVPGGLVMPIDMRSDIVITDVH
jgi:hypothetical protein